MNTMAAREEPRALGWRLVGFLPAVALALLPLLHPHLALTLAPTLAVPLYLIAAAAWFATSDLPSFAAVFSAQLRGGLWRSWLALAVLGAALAWPAARLAQGGDLASALAFGLVVGVALVLAWQRAALPAQALMQSRDTLLGIPHDHAGEATRGGAAGWIAAGSLVLLALCALALALPALWPSVAIFRSGVVAHALILAPLLALLALSASRRQLARAQGALADRLAEAAAAPVAARTYTPGPGVNAALYEAARAGQVAEALRLLDMGGDPWSLPAADARDQRTLPMLAAVLGDLRLLRALIGAGVDLNLAHAGLTPLMAAVRDSYHGRPDAVQMLLTNGADPRPIDDTGQTALHAAARAADPAIAALLLDAGAPLDVLDAQGASPLGVAAALGNLDVARYLIERRAAVEPRGGDPAVVLAATREDDDPAMLQLLLRHRAQVDARDRLGRTALHAACLRNNHRIAAALLAAGAHADIADGQGVTPLLEAARSGSLACVECLADHGVDPGACDHSGRNALAIACHATACDTATVKALLALGVDPQRPAADGRRAIDYAVAAGRWAHVALLDPGYVLPACLAETDEELVDAPPLTRLRLALERENFDTARQLLPLATASGSERAALFLDLAPRLGRGASRVLAAQLDPDATDEEGMPLMSRLLALGPAATAGLVALLERGSSPSGRGTLARYLNAALLDARDRPDGEDVALLLLSRGADPFGADSGGTPPLQQVLRLGWRRLFDQLLALGVDPEARDLHGATALLQACQLDSEWAVRRLVAHGAQPSTRGPDGQTAHGLALALGHGHLVRWLDWSQWRLPRRRLRGSDLVAAAQVGDAAGVSRLLDLGLDLNATDAQGCTAMLRACGGGHVDLVRDLLARGANPDLTANSGATCLSVALTARQIEVVWALVESGVSVEQRLPGGITPLMIAAALGQGQAIVALLAHDVDVQAADAHGGTVLHALAQFGFGARDAEAVSVIWESLLAAGADADAVNGVGETPLLLLLGASFEPGTAYREDVILAQLDVLLRYGVGLGARERRGFGPLHLAALHGMGRAVRRLLAAGADPNLRDTLNRRAGEVALVRGYVDIASEFVHREPTPPIARFLREPRE
ncbi:ankyrin repeat domain-containing protein [Denitratimonas tolerans]|uniref:Ankyrin repeat domain-containing protein n=1 Tax=Denitratimonas tolerans TaxID=1338420 RepID=A0AAW9R4R0_9GAMM